MAPGTPGPELRGLRSAPGCALRQAGLRGARGDGGCDPAVPGLPEGLRPRPFLLPPWAACCRGEKAEAARKKLSVPLPGSAPSANRTPCRILSSADNVSSQLSPDALVQKPPRPADPVERPHASVPRSPSECHLGFTSSTFQISLSSSLCMSVWHPSSSFTPIVDLVKGFRSAPFISLVIAVNVDKSLLPACCSSMIFILSSVYT
ncbi:uncharacterized protein LOC113460175 isoform X1 [Zonotrichia albicollis]|uniref:uncharacterized protein LOC113460175 isoform X1 n=1 Tax=Zonotrichia albicollis TaxID=44394 RepID=UPI003D80FDBC